jgi:hypothetical protein
MIDCRRKFGSGFPKNFASELPEHKLMHGSWRIVGLVLLIATAANLPGMQAMPSTAAPASHPAGCHGHTPGSQGPAIPSPAPTSYQCCVSGHQAALPNVAFSLRSHAALLCNLNDGASLDSDLAPDALPVVFVVPSDSPPVTGSLRI